MTITRKIVAPTGTLEVEMRFCYNTTPEETVSYLREQAIGAKQPAAVIDAIDALAGLLDTPAEIEKLEQQVNELESDRDDLRDELSTLVEHMETAVDTIASVIKSPADAAEMCDLDELRELQRYLDFAKKALERHKA